MSVPAASPHVPVLLAEVLDALAPQPGDLIVDATFGAGGYTRAFLDAGATVHAFDRDPEAIAAGREWPETRDIPVIVVSIVDERSRGVELGAAAYLVKPIRREELLSALAGVGLPVITHAGPGGEGGE